MEKWQGKHFSITDPNGVRTVIYQVNKTEKEFLKDSPKYTVQRLDSTQEIVGNAQRKTFYIDNPSEYEDQLVILSFGKDRVVVNTALVQGNKISLYTKFKETYLYNRSRNYRGSKAYALF